MKQVDVLIVGAGAAGMTAACTLKRRAPSLKVLLVDRGARCGGVLCQCVHDGFGQGYFGESMTGTAYAARLREQLDRHAPELWLETEALSLSAGRTAWLSGPRGRTAVGFRQLVLAAGCLERGAGPLLLGGSRPAGVYTAGEVQAMMNLDGRDAGSTAVVLGSGDVGLVVARQLKQRGVRVVEIVEQRERSPALERNIRQCVVEQGIPLRLRATVTRLHGRGRLCGVTVGSLADGAETYLPCDLLVTALGMIPDRRLCRDLGDPPPDWLHLCGNCERVYPIVDAVSFQAEAVAEKLLFPSGRQS